MRKKWWLHDRWIDFKVWYTWTRHEQWNSIKWWVRIRWDDFVFNVVMTLTMLMAVTALVASCWLLATIFPGSTYDFKPFCPQGYVCSYKHTGKNSSTWTIECPPGLFSQWEDKGSYKTLVCVKTEVTP